MYAGDWYNHPGRKSRITWQNQRFLSDRTNFIVGVPYLKQHRMSKPYVVYEKDEEDTMHYTEHWLNPNLDYNSITYNYSSKELYKKKLWTYYVPSQSPSIFSWHLKYSGGGYPEV